MTFGDLFRLLRQAGWTRANIARGYGISASTVTRALNGREPGVRLVQKAGDQ